MCIKRHRCTYVYTIMEKNFQLEYHVFSVEGAKGGPLNYSYPTRSTGLRLVCCGIHIILLFALVELIFFAGNNNKNNS